MPVSTDRLLFPSRTALRATLGYIREPSLLKEFLLFYREDKGRSTASAIQFGVLELLSDYHTGTSIQLGGE